MLSSQSSGTSFAARQLQKILSKEQITSLNTFQKSTFLNQRIIMLLKHQRLTINQALKLTISQQYALFNPDIYVLIMTEAVNTELVLTIFESELQSISIHDFLELIQKYELTAKQINEFTELQKEIFSNPYIKYLLKWSYLTTEQALSITETHYILFEDFNIFQMLIKQLVDANKLLNLTELQQICLLNKNISQLILNGIINIKTVLKFTIPEYEYYSYELVCDYISSFLKSNPNLNWDSLPSAPESAMQEFVVKMHEYEKFFPINTEKEFVSNSVRSLHLRYGRPLIDLNTDELATTTLADTQEQEQESKEVKMPPAKSSFRLRSTFSTIALTQTPQTMFAEERRPSLTPAQTEVLIKDCDPQSGYKNS